MKRVLLLLTAALSMASFAGAAPADFNHSRHRRDFKTLGISCGDCHSFSVKSEGAAPLDSNVRKGLIKPTRQVCLFCHGPGMSKQFQSRCTECHEDRAAPAFNHPGEGIQCLECHRPKEFAHASLKLAPEESGPLCLKCHAIKDFHHPDVSPLAKTANAQSILLNNGRLACLSCHQVHGVNRERKFLVNQQKAAVFCSSCHGVRAQNLFSRFHELTGKKSR